MISRPDFMVAGTTAAVMVITGSGSTARAQPRAVNVVYGKKSPD